MNGEKIIYKNDELQIPDNPIILFIEGDGIGPDIMSVTRPIVDNAVKKVYKNKKKIYWHEIYAGEKAEKKYGNVMPDETVSAIKDYKVVLKGPLTTPVSGGYRSLNVFLRQKLDLYACIRPIQYIRGTPSPVVHPEKLNVVIFRENTEDVYAGIEWQSGSDDAKKVIEFINENFGKNIRLDSGIGVKPMSEFASKRLVRAAIKYAIKNKRKSVTLVHKGNIMKYTEGAFRNWGYEVAEQEFKNYITREDLNTENSEAKIVIKDRIADSMFQQVLLRAEDYDVIALPNLNGDYLSDACAAQVGGLGMAPGANIGDSVAIFEATHGSAPKYANQDKVNPCSLILSAVLMLEYIGFEKAASLIKNALEQTILSKKVTYDLARLLAIEPVSTSEFGREVIKRINESNRY